MAARFPLVVVIVWPVLALATGQLPGQQPTFRSSAELIIIDTHVVRRDGTPIEGLKPDQFEVFIDGRRRPVAFSEFVRGSDAPAADAGGAVKETTPFPGGRVIVLAIDQASFPTSARASAIEAARRVAETVTPADYLGLVAFPGTVSVAPTRDRQPVRDGITRISGVRPDVVSPRFNISASEATQLMSRTAMETQEIIRRECRNDFLNPTCPAELIQDGASIANALEHQAVLSLTGLHGVLDAMSAIPGRKTLILVSAGLPMANRAGARPNLDSETTRLAQRAAAANVNLYVFYMNVHFLRAFSPEYGKRHHTLFDDITMFGYGLEKFADSGGGSFFQVEVDSDPFVDRALRETSAFYALGVQVRPEDRDGREHFIRVAVKQRGATTRYRKVVVIPRVSDPPVGR